MVEVKDFMISETTNVMEAMEKLDKVAKKVLFVTKGNVLLATVTDGDIRRWLLNKGDTKATMKEVANYEPRFLYEGERTKGKQFMKKCHIEAVPIVNEKKEIVSIILWNDKAYGGISKIEVPVVIMAGGLGTRLYPYTKILPKPLIPVGDIPIAEHIINRFKENGCSEYYMVVNHKKSMIKAYFNEIERDYTVEYVEENEPLGTGGGLALLKGKITNTFILSNCDILIDEVYKKIYDLHKQEGNVITMVCSLKNITIPYGVIEIGPNGNIETMKEKPQYSFFTNTGMYVVEPRVIDELEDNVFMNFTDIIEKYRAKGEKIGVYPISEHSWLDMGQLDELEEMKRRVENHGA